MTYSTFLAICHFVYAGVFALIGLFMLLANNSTTSYLGVAFLMASVGLGFGTNLVLFPVIIGMRYGNQNFGKASIA
jgi:hypothetical protein